MSRSSTGPRSAHGRTASPAASTPAMDVVVLAGGGSSRFGGDKVVHPRNGRRQVDVVVDMLRAAGGRVVVAAGDRSLHVPGTVEVPDARGIPGPLAGVLAGLEVARTPFVALVAADLVQPSVCLLRALAAHAASLDAPGAMPLVNGRPQPLHSVVARNVLDELRTTARTGEHGLIVALHGAGVVPVAHPVWRRWVPGAVPDRDIDTRADLLQLR